MAIKLEMNHKLQYLTIFEYFEYFDNSGTRVTLTMKQPVSTQAVLLRPLTTSTAEASSTGMQMKLENMKSEVVLNLDSNIFCCHLVSD